MGRRRRPDVRGAPLTDETGDAYEDEQARVYAEQAEDYDVLIAAEDADGELRDALMERAPTAGKRVADIGAGTGRLARWVAPAAQHVHLIDRAPAMLEIARRHLAADGLSHKTSIHVGDATALPLADDSVDAALAGWVFGHFRHWMPDGWRRAVDDALEEMRRVVAGGGAMAIIETLGTGYETPREDSGLEPYFEHLEAEHGFRRSWHRTDYVFGDPATAARAMGAFFGEEMAATVQDRRWSRVPECTALFVCDP